MQQPDLHWRVRDLTGALILASVAALGGCKAGQNNSASNDNPVPTVNLHAASDPYRHICARPRSGTDPTTLLPYPDRQGSLSDEKRWLQAWSDEDYLWYRELPVISPYGSEALLTYFSLLQTNQVTPSGKLKDSYHYALTSAEAAQLLSAQSKPGGLWVEDSASGRIYLAQAINTAQGTNLPRGSELLSIDGASGPALRDEVLALGSDEFPEDHLYQVQAPGRAAEWVSLSATAPAPVQNVTSFRLNDGRLVGYFSYTDHAFSTETPLYNAINQLKQDGIQDLILDMRLNGGGSIYVASVLASMIGDRSLIGNQPFERNIYNDKHRPDTYPFFTQAAGYTYGNGQLFNGALPRGTPLPNLGLRRLFVLTSGGTCSASESVINSLRGVGIQVIQIGTTTCGKPYGFIPLENCGYTYYSINFHSQNARGEGDYTDGLDPRQPVQGALAGCYVPNGLGFPLGDPSEPLLATALYFAQYGQCPNSKTLARGLLSGGLPSSETHLLQPSWRNTQFLLPGSP